MHETSELPGLDPVLEVVADLAEAFLVRGYRLYLVGGVVRDVVLDSFAAADDIDLTTDARPDAIKDVVRPRASVVWTQGERFGTIGATIRGRNVEITTHRAEAYDETSRKPVVSFGQSIDEDLSRRDFTINAMAISLPDRALLDPYHGLDDLRAGLLRTPLAPELSFADDPLRMLRAARFLPRFELTADPAVVAAATDMADRLAIVSVERVHDELERLLALDDPGRGLDFLDRTGLLEQIVPPLAAGPARTEALALAAAPGSVTVRRAGLLSPLGEAAGSALARLRYSRNDAARTARLVEAVGPTLTPEASDETVRRVVDRIGFADVDELRALSTNVRRQRGLSDADGPFFERLAALSSSEDLADFAPPVTGGRLIDELDLEPGPAVGRAVAYLRDRRFRHGPMSEEEAIEAVRSWLADRSG
ncbi:MAG: CCA tRNA nucleotidyltransferase [Acidimicrobiia bacterium]|nr:CCA tRNA nucleotidyltransferase [Acidimicrobiia bacterium]